MRRNVREMPVTGIDWAEIMIVKKRNKVLRPVHTSPKGEKYVRIDGKRFVLEGEKKLYRCLI